MSETDKEKSSKQNKERHAPSLKGICIIVVLLVVYILFNMLGAYIFVLIEKDTDQPNAELISRFIEIKRNFTENHNRCMSTQDLDEFLEEVQLVLVDSIDVTGNSSSSRSNDNGKWSLHNAFLLAFTISSTIGYGVVTPVKPGGQLFCILFAFLGIPFTGLLAAKIGFVMAYYIKKVTTTICSRIPMAKTLSIVFTTVIGTVLYIVVPSLLLTFVGNDEEWTFVQCLYCVIITLTTIGFGYLVPDPSSQGGMLTTVVVLIWVVAGLAWFATIVNLVATSMSKQAKKISMKVIPPPLKKQLGKKHIDGGKSGGGGEKFSTSRSDNSHELGYETDVRKASLFCSDACIQTEPIVLGPGGVHAIVHAQMDKEWPQ